MNLIIQSSKNFTVSEKMKSYIKKRLEKLNYFKNHIMEINFHLDTEKYISKVDVTLSLKKLGVQKFEVTDREMYNAIDKIVHKMDVKINREKTKVQSHNKPGHEEFVEFFNDHESNNPEPTENVKVSSKPTTLNEAFLQMKQNSDDFIGFMLIEKENSLSPAFLRKLDDNILYLFKRKDDNTYQEYSLTVTEDEVKIDNEIREIKLSKMSIIEAQKDILMLDYHFNLFVDSSSKKIGFLFKEGNGKWKLIS